jgi:hypothetical protein
MATSCRRRWYMGCDCKEQTIKVLLKYKSKTGAVEIEEA